MATLPVEGEQPGLAAALLERPRLEWAEVRQVAAVVAGPAAAWPAAVAEAKGLPAEAAVGQRRAAAGVGVWQAPEGGPTELPAEVAPARSAMPALSMAKLLAPRQTQIPAFAVAPTPTRSLRVSARMR